MNAFRSPALAEAKLRRVIARPVKPSRVLHFTLSVTDLDRAQKFYEEVVGCTFWRRNETTVFMRCGDDCVALSCTGYHTPPNRNRDTLIHHAFVVQGEDFDAAVAHVDGCGFEVLLYEDTGHRGFPGRHAYFLDPDGNCIELVDLQDPGARERASGRRAKSHLHGSPA